MQNPKISILFTLYNGKKYLDYSLNSLLAQTYDNFEILITDDGSLDNSAGYIINNFSDHRIKLFIQENKGKNAALNNSLNNITGDYVTIFDHDDYWNKYYLENSISVINRTHVDCILSKAEIVYDYCPKLQNLLVKPAEKDNVEIIEFHEAMNLYCSDDSIHFYLTNKIFKKKIFNCFQFDSNLILDDISSTHLLMTRCESFSVVKSSIYYHISSLTSLGTKTSGRHILEQLAIIHMDRFNHFQTYSPNKRYFELIYRDTLNTLLTIYLKLLVKESDLILLSKISDFLRSKKEDIKLKTGKINYLVSKFFLEKNLNIRTKNLIPLLNLIIQLNRLIKKILRTFKYYYMKAFKPC